MTQLPQLIRGRVGPIKFDDMNEVFRHVERDAIEEVDEAIEDQERRSRKILARATGTEAHPTAPFNSVLSWVELMIDRDLLLVPLDNGRSSTLADNDFARPAISIPPPFGLLHAYFDSDGVDRYVWQASPTVYAGRIQAVSGSPGSATYDVRSIDDQVGGTDMVPINRFSGINYSPLAVNDLALLIAFAASPDFGTGTFTVALVAFEQPEITDCDAQPAGFGDSFIGF